MIWPFPEYWYPHPSAMLEQPQRIPLVLPETTPVDQATFKLAARISSTADDADIDRLLLAATERVERLAAMTFRAGQYRLEYNRFPRSNLPIPIGDKVDVVTAIIYLDPDRNQQVLDPGSYLADVRAEYALIYPQAGVMDEWPDGNTVGVTYTQAVPEIARQAIILLANHWYEHRETWTELKGADIPHGVIDLIRQMSAEGVIA